MISYSSYDDMEMKVNFEFINRYLWNGLFDRKSLGPQWYFLMLPRGYFCLNISIYLMLSYSKYQSLMGLLVQYCYLFAYAFLFTGNKNNS